MKVFISWSGERSKAVAKIFNNWLRQVLQASEPWMSDKDIDRGAGWFSEISTQLADTQIGIVCLTRENKEKPWIMFESGALAKGLSDSRVCTLLIDLTPEQVTGPLAQFNHTEPNKGGFFKLLATINAALGEAALREDVLESVFEMYWPRLEGDFKKALKENESQVFVEPRTEASILTEILNSVRGFEHRLRGVENEVGRTHKGSQLEKDKIFDILNGKKSKRKPFGIDDLIAGAPDDPDS